MLEDATHLLQTNGVLSSFSIAKRISQEEIAKLLKQIKRKHKGKTKLEYQTLLVDLMIEKTNSAEPPPPGVILPEITSEQEQLKKLHAELGTSAAVIADKILKMKLDKTQLCFLIEAIVNILELTEEDFEKFQEECGEDDDEEEYDEEEYDDDEDDDEDGSLLGL